MQLLTKYPRVREHKKKVFKRKTHLNLEEDHKQATRFFFMTFDYNEQDEEKSFDILIFPKTFSDDYFHEQKYVNDFERQREGERELRITI